MGAPPTRGGAGGVVRPGGARRGVRRLGLRPHPVRRQTRRTPSPRSPRRGSPSSPRRASSSWRSSPGGTSSRPRWSTRPARSCTRSGRSPASPRSPTPTPRAPAICSRRRPARLVTVELGPALDHDEALAVADQVAAALRTIDAPQVLVGGELLAERSLRRAGGQGRRVRRVRGAGGALRRARRHPRWPGGRQPAPARRPRAVAATLLALTRAGHRGAGQRVRRQRRHAARHRPRRRLQPADPRPVPRGAGRDRGAVPDLACSAGPSRRPGGPCSSPGLAVGAALAGCSLLADPLLAAMALGGALVVGLATVAGLTLVRRWSRSPTSASRRRRHGRAARTRPAARGPRRCWRGWPGSRSGAGPLVALAVTAGLLLLSLPLLQVIRSPTPTPGRCPPAARSGWPTRPCERDFPRTCAPQPSPC